MSKQLSAGRTSKVEQNPWKEIGELAAKYRVLNLAGGFSDFLPPKFLREALCEAVSGGNALHQYTGRNGHPPLVKNVAKFFSRIMEREIDPSEDVLITVGASQALYNATQALVDEGDEVVVIEPFFEVYGNQVKMAGGTAVYVPLRPKAVDGAVLSSADWVLSAEELTSKFSPRTKAIVINNPNNPLGKVYSTEELQLIADLCIKHNVICISDEVYEWLTYDGAKHVKIASLPGMWERTVTIGSAGKTFSATGWKVGWAICPQHIMKHLRTINDFSVRHCPTVLQEAVARGFEREYEVFGTPESYFQQLPAMLHPKRQKLASCLESVGLKPVIPEGGYYMMADISSVMAEVDSIDQSSEDEPMDFRFVKWLIKEKRLATLPISSFCSPERVQEFGKYIRFCFIKEDSTLDSAEEILRKWIIGQ